MAEKKNKSIKIGIIQQSPDLGGAEFFMLALLTEFKNLDNEVILAANAGKYFNQAQKENIETQKLPGIMDVMGNTRGLVKTIVFLPFYLIFYLNLLWKWKKAKVDVILMSGFSEKIFVSFLSIILFSSLYILYRCGSLL